MNNVAATMSFECRDDARAIASLDEISPICAMELWRGDERVVRRDAKLRTGPPRTADADAKCADGLSELERRIHENERNLVLIRADHERRATPMTARLLATIEETLRDMKEYRLLLIAASVERSAG